MTFLGTMKAIRWTAIAVLGAVGVGWSAEPETRKAESQPFFAELKQSAPMHYLLMTKRKHDAVFEMLPSIEDIDAIEPLTGATPLTMAARDETSDAYDVVKAMVLQYGADPAAPDRKGFTALHYAAQAGNLPVVEFLVTQGADLNASPTLRDGKKGRQTPLYMAYQRKRGRVAAYLELMGARQLDTETQAQLDFDAKISEVLDNFKYRRMPEGADPVEWQRRILNEAHREMKELLEPMGLVELADRLAQTIEPTIEAMQSMQRPEGMSFSDWKRLIAANIHANIAANDRSEK